MRILYISGAATGDYQCDLLFHGFKALFGDDVVDVNRLWHLYAHEFDEKPELRKTQYGKGFTTVGLLPPDSLVDRLDIQKKIEHRYFDIIIYGNIHRSQMYLEKIFRYYDPQNIIFIDGEDYPIPAYWQVYNRGLYFKREIWQDGSPLLLPIQICYPEEKMSGPRSKTKLTAFIDPRDKSTYIYDNESEYYEDYHSSYFAYTIPKAGWEALRHYEIMGNDCAPLFIGLAKCPDRTLFRMPRYEINEMVKLFESKPSDYFFTDEGHSIWREKMDGITDHFRRFLTTRAMAQYIIDTWHRNRR